MSNNFLAVIVSAQIQKNAALD
jgi:hypothetical protein